jgi:putative hydrolases of HD superfamily
MSEQEISEQAPEFNGGPAERDRSIVNFLFEVGTMRHLPRMHRQVLLNEDMTDTIASHSYRVAIIAWFLAKIENADPYKCLAMGTFHDIAEARTGDHNWIHKRYTKMFESEVHNDQLKTLPFPDTMDIMTEYELRESKEAIVTKQADILDQILLLREYEWQGNKEAMIWLYGKESVAGNESTKGQAQLKKLTLPSAIELGKMIYEVSPSEWWENIWTSKNR